MQLAAVRQNRYSLSISSSVNYKSTVKITEQLSF